MRGEARWERWLPPAISLIAGAALWEIVGRNTSAAFLAPFSTTIERLVALIVSGQFLEALGQSLGLFATGFGIAVLVGVPLGLVLARVPLLRVATESYIMMLYATPMAALAPFILSLMGFGFEAKAVVVFLFAVFPVLYNTVEGARSVRPELVEVARSFRSGEWQLWRDVMIPYTLPYTMTGIRQAIARGLVGMVAAEFFLSPSGLGELIVTGSQSFDTARMLGAILTIVLVGVALMDVGRYLERRLAAWKEYGT